MEVVNSSNNHLYENKFDAKKYLDMLYKIDPENSECEVSLFFLKYFTSVFSSGRVKGENLIEIGAGPTIFYILAACEVFEKIYLTDYFQGNLDEINKWMNSEKDAFDWSPYLRIVCDLENNGSTPEGKEEKIRRNVSVMKSDLTLKNPLHPISLPLTDCMLITNCLSCVFKNFTDLKIAIKNVVSMIKPGGHLIICDFLGDSFYYIGEEKFPLLSLDENVVQEAVAENGCKIEEFQTSNEFHHMFCLLAKKVEVTEDAKINFGSDSTK